ncbi:Type I phosphodiesterase / nucleotide pyrophosphatase [bacterium A37T11]|nr:Type I phosphodiesterase / nucleotide pyrophosphatase [bacterium A37T11]
MLGYIIKKNIFWKMLLYTLISSIILSCNEDFKKLIETTNQIDSMNVTYGESKVLYLIVDGLRGKSLQSANVPNIKSLLTNSIYSYYSLNDEDSKYIYTNWADMLTGVDKSKHLVEGDLRKNNFIKYPIIFKHVKELSSKYKVYSISDDPVFSQYFGAEAINNLKVSSDEEVESKTVESLSDDSVTMLTAHFTQVNKVGKLYGYDISKSQYADAIQNFDNSVGKILNALKSRRNYSKERWLVIIASSKGGDYTIDETQNDHTIFSKPINNTFTIYWSSTYKTNYINKPFVGNNLQGEFIRFGNTHSAYVSEGENSLYNFGTRVYTIEIKIKKNPGIDSSYKFTNAPIIRKIKNWSTDSSSNGWSIYLDGNSWKFSAIGSQGKGTVSGGTLSDATWNNITVECIQKEDIRYIRTYTNGNFNNETNIQNWGYFDNPNPLALGHQNGDVEGTLDAYLADVRIWNAALPDEVISKYSCLGEINDDHPYFNLLTGNWPMVDIQGNKILDQGPFSSNMTLTGGIFTKKYLTEYLCAPSASELSMLVPRGVDIPAQIISWLKIPRNEDWDLDGRVWLDE